MLSAAFDALGSCFQPVLALAQDICPKDPVQPPELPKAATEPADTPSNEIDEQLQSLHANKQAWSVLPPSKRADLLEECLRLLPSLAVKYAKLSTQGKGSYGGGCGEEISSLSGVAMGLREYVDNLRQGGRQAPNAVVARPDGQLVVKVFPHGPLGLLFGGFKGEVWLQPGCAATQGSVYKLPPPPGSPSVPAPAGGVALVLGAGNQLGVAIMDVLYCLIADNEVVVMKASPVNGACLGPLVEELFAPLVRRHWVKVVYGGRAVGEYCVSHRLVDRIHLTGSADTFNAIVWGPKGPQPPPAKQPLSKPVSAELGNVTPFIIIPSHTHTPWTDKELEYHANNVVGGLAQNASHNCIAAEVVVTARDWPQRGQFMDALRRRLAATQMRVPYYPGARAKYDKFVKRFPGAVALGAPLAGGAEGGAVPWLLAEGLAPEEAATQEENWCGVLQEVVLPCGTDPVEFMRMATKYVNTQVWGSLAASVTIHPKTQKRCAAAFDDMLAALQYGQIVVNAPPTVGFTIGRLTWGAFPGNTVHEVQSGLGVVHNTLLLDHPQKSVLHAPWRYAPKPLWWVSHTSLERLMPAFMDFVVHIHHPLLAPVHIVRVVLAALAG